MNPVERGLATVAKIADAVLKLIPSAAEQRAARPEPFRDDPPVVEEPGGPSSPPGSAGQPWAEWATPTICDVLAEHIPIPDDGFPYSPAVWCASRHDDQVRVTHGLFDDRAAWRAHVARSIAERLEAREADKRIAAQLEAAGYCTTDTYPHLRGADK